MPDIPELTEDGGYFYSPPEEDAEEVWDEATEVTQEVACKLTDKKIITRIKLQDGAAVTRSDMFSEALSLDRIVRGSARMLLWDDEVEMLFTGYSDEGHHDTFTVEWDDTYRTTRIGQIAKHKLISLRVATDWDDSGLSAVRW